MYSLFLRYRAINSNCRLILTIHERFVANFYPKNTHIKIYNN